jgi:hypothetical protein
MSAFLTWWLVAGLGGILVFLLFGGWSEIDEPIKRVLAILLIVITGPIGVICFIGWRLTR